MKQKTHILASVILALSLMISGFATSTAMAAFEPIEYEGTITSVTDGGAPFTFDTEEGYEVTVGIDGDSFSIKVVDEEGNTVGSYQVSGPEGFEFTGLAEEDEFELKAEYDEENGVWQFTELKVQNQEQEQNLLGEDDEGQEQENENDGKFCSDSEENHPVAEAIAGKYKTDYETVIGMFCSGGGDDGSARTGFGQIMLAFQTAEMTEDDDTGADILALRLEGNGWGQIWQELDLIGKPDNPGKSNNAGEKPENPGNKPEDPGNGHKPDGVGPDDVGPPEDVNPPGHSKRPDHSGKPNHAGPKK